MTESESQIAIFAKLCVASLVVVIVSRVWKIFFPYYIPGIPVERANTIFGFSIDKKRNERLDSHLQMLEIAEEKGKLFQYYWFGHHFVMINDKFIAKHVMDGVTGKGFFHVLN
jgi:hypothetical protein